MVPMRSSHHVDQLCLLPRRVSTAGSLEIAKGSVVLFFFPPLTLTQSPSFFFLFFLFFNFFFLFFLFFSFFFLLSFLSHLPPSDFFFLQVRRSFLSLCYSSCHVSHFPWSMCHMDNCSRWHSPHHMALMTCVLLPWCHVVVFGHAM